MTTKSYKISVAKLTGPFLAQGIYSMWVSGKVCAITTDTWLMEASCLQVYHLEEPALSYCENFQ